MNHIEDVVTEALDEFDRNFSPDKASKAVYAEALAQLIADAQVRLEAVRGEIEAEEEE